jgi:hypothetical protein
MKNTKKRGKFFNKSCTPFNENFAKDRPEASYLTQQGGVKETTKAYITGQKSSDTMTQKKHT